MQCRVPVTQGLSIVVRHRPFSHSTVITTNAGIQGSDRGVGAFVELSDNRETLPSDPKSTT